MSDKFGAMPDEDDDDDVNPDTPNNAVINKLKAKTKAPPPKV